MSVIGRAIAGWQRTLALGLLVGTACTSGPVASSPSPKHSATPPAPASPVTASSSPGALVRPGPVTFAVTTVAQNLEAPWAAAFGASGDIWVTERPGRVRIIRNGSLLAAPALTLSVVSQPGQGCEGGLLGIAVAEPSVFLFYTHAGGSGNTNRVSRFTISGNALTGEQVLLDGIPGGTCYHFGGRLKIGPDGWLYVTTGEGFVASRAADRNSLSGKILRMHTDGSGEEMYAWGFRNPQGLAFDSAGDLYASNNGPTGEFNLCCHDEVDQVVAGGFYGWPAYAANVPTGYAGLGPRVAPVIESGQSVWAPSGIAFYTAHPGETQALFVTELRGQALRRIVIDPLNRSGVLATDLVLEGYGRLRDVVAGPGPCLYVLTSNRDGRGSPAATDDRLLRLCPA